MKRGTSKRFQLHLDKRIVISFLTNSNHMGKIALYRAIRIRQRIITGNVLDFGCGAKPYESLFKNCKSYIGVDIEISGHDHESSFVDYFYNGETLPWGDSEFDSVVSFEVFEHLPDPRKSVEEIKRIMKPNGTFLLTVPFLYGEHETPYDFQRWTSYGLVKFLSEVGFKDIEITKLNQTPAFALQLFVNIFMNKIMYNRLQFWRFLFIPLICFCNLVLLILKLVLPTTSWFYSNLLVTAKKTD